MVPDTTPDGFRPGCGPAGTPTAVSGPTGPHNQYGGPPAKARVPITVIRSTGQIRRGPVIGGRLPTVFASGSPGLLFPGVVAQALPVVHGSLCAVHTGAQSPGEQGPVAVRDGLLRPARSSPATAARRGALTEERAQGIEDTAGQ